MSAMVQYILKTAQTAASVVFVHHVLDVKTASDVSISSIKNTAYLMKNSRK
jgi:hypothetical protein